MKDDDNEARVVPFKSVDQLKAERAFRHLSDHLLTDPCYNCVDRDTRYCIRECPSGDRMKKNV